MLEELANTKRASSMPEQATKSTQTVRLSQTERFVQTHTVPDIATYLRPAQPTIQPNSFTTTPPELSNYTTTDARHEVIELAANTEGTQQKISALMPENTSNVRPTTSLNLPETKATRTPQQSSPSNIFGIPPISQLNSTAHQTDIPANTNQSVPTYILQPNKADTSAQQTTVTLNTPDYLPISPRNIQPTIPVHTTVYQQSSTTSNTGAQQTFSTHKTSPREHIGLYCYFTTSKF